MARPMNAAGSKVAALHVSSSSQNSMPTVEQAARQGAAAPQLLTASSTNSVLQANNACPARFASTVTTGLPNWTAPAPGAHGTFASGGTPAGPNAFEGTEDSSWQRRAVPLTASEGPAGRLPAWTHLSPLRSVSQAPPAHVTPVWPRRLCTSAPADITAQWRASPSDPAHAVPAGLDNLQSSDAQRPQQAQEHAPHLTLASSAGPSCMDLLGTPAQHIIAQVPMGMAARAVRQEADLDEAAGSWKARRLAHIGSPRSGHPMDRASNGGAAAWMAYPDEKPHWALANADYAGSAPASPRRGLQEQGQQESAHSAQQRQNSAPPMLRRPGALMFDAAEGTVGSPVVQAPPPGTAHAAALRDAADGVEPLQHGVFATHMPSPGVWPSQASMGFVSNPSAGNSLGSGYGLPASSQAILPLQPSLNSDNAAQNDITGDVNMVPFHITTARSGGCANRKASVTTSHDATSSPCTSRPRKRSCEHTSPADVQRALEQQSRRQLINRESARRTRQRRQELIERTTRQVADLEQENARLEETNAQLAASVHAANSMAAAMAERICLMEKDLQSLQLENISLAKRLAGTKLTPEQRPRSPAVAGIPTASPAPSCGLLVKQAASMAMTGPAELPTPFGKDRPAAGQAEADVEHCPAQRCATPDLGMVRSSGTMPHAMLPAGNMAPIQAEALPQLPSFPRLPSCGISDVGSLPHFSSGSLSDAPSFPRLPSECIAETAAFIQVTSSGLSTSLACTPDSLAQT